MLQGKCIVLVAEYVCRLSGKVEVVIRVERGKKNMPKQKVLR